MRDPCLHGHRDGNRHDLNCISVLHAKVVWSHVMRDVPARVVSASDLKAIIQDTYLLKIKRKPVGIGGHDLLELCVQPDLHSPRNDSL